MSPDNNILDPAPLVSIIVPCYNAANWIENAIHSCVRQNYRPLEVLVVDDGSTDASWSMISSFVTRYPKLVTAFRQSNQGAPHARNVGFAKSKGVFVKWLDADDVLSENTILSQVRALESSNATIAYGPWKVVTEKEDGTIITSDILTACIDSDPAATVLHLSGWAPLFSYLMKRSAVEEVGGWDESLPCMQDVDLVFRMARRNTNFIHTTTLTGIRRRPVTPTLATRNAEAFNSQCLRLYEIAFVHFEKTGWSPWRKTVLSDGYGWLARSFFLKRPHLFDLCLNRLNHIHGRYVPSRPLGLRWLSYICGYRFAEHIARWYRMFKPSWGPNVVKNPILSGASAKATIPNGKTFSIRHISFLFRTAITKKITRYLDELTSCFQLGADWQSRFTLVKATIAFHCANAAPRFLRSSSNPRQFLLRTAGAPTPVWLRPTGGDIFIFHEIFLDRIYDIPENVVSANVGTIVDLGAHIGLTTLFFLNTYPNARVMCVEPNPTNVALLGRNLKNHASQTAIIAGAAGGTFGDAGLDMSGATWQASLKTTSSNMQTISVFPMTHIMNQMGWDHIDILKIDIEGSEKQVLEQCDSWIERVDVILIELHQPYTLEHLASWISPFGFSVFPPNSSFGNKTTMAVHDRCFSRR